MKILLLMWTYARKSWQRFLLMSTSNQRKEYT
jgi:hypothetical protein